MSQDRQLQLVTSVMISAGFEVSEKFTLRPRSFDLIARNNGTLLVIKVVTHIDSVSEEAAFDLDVISHHLGGVPLIVGERAREAELERGAVYVRYGIYAISVSTLYDYFVEKIPPLVYASPGGLYVNINGDALRELREGQRMSLGDLGQVLGVSRRTISKYEGGMGTTLEVAIRIEEYFNTGVVESIDIVRREPAESGHEEPKRRQGPGIPIEFFEQARDAASHAPGRTVPGSPHVRQAYHPYGLRPGAESGQTCRSYQQPLEDRKEARDVYYHRLPSRKEDRPDARDR